MLKLLLFRGTPRDNIPDVMAENPKLLEHCDLLEVKFAFEFDAYKYARDYFLEHDYDYLIIATDDIVVKPEHVKQLRWDLENLRMKDGKQYPVLSGMMNVDQQEYMDQWGNLNICYVLGLKDRRLRSYDWIKRNQLPSEDIFQVKFAGFGLTAIKREIVELFPFNSDGIFRGTGVSFGASLDFVFCWYCHDYEWTDKKGEHHKSIPIFVDQRIDMQHLRISGESQAGNREKEVWLNGKLLHMGLINSI